MPALALLRGTLAVVIVAFQLAVLVTALAAAIGLMRRSQLRLALVLKAVIDRKLAAAQMGGAEDVRVALSRTTLVRSVRQILGQVGSQPPLARSVLDKRGDAAHREETGPANSRAWPCALGRDPRASSEGEVVFVELSEAAQDDLPAIAKDQHRAAVFRPHLDIGGREAVEEDRVIGAVEVGDRVVAVVDAARSRKTGRGPDRR